MAAAVNCPEETGVGCGHCSSCERIARRRHPDVHHVAPEGPLIPVDQIRESVIPEAARSPFEGRRKVFIIEEAERMNDAAQNALLKTLEEPQPDTMFVLISDREDELLETIQSRCRIVRLEPLSTERVIEILESQGASADDARIAAAVAAGDPELARRVAFDRGFLERRRLWASIPGRLDSAVSALDAAAEIVDQGRKVAKDREREQKQEVVDLAEAMGEGRGTAQARNALAKRHKREVRRAEEDALGEALEFLATFYRDVLALRSGAIDGFVNADLVDELRPWAKGDVADIAFVCAVERCIQARESLTHNANVPLAIEAAVLDVARLVPPPSGIGVGAQG
jgi:DNA polymerase-3 subunit delta'